MFAVFQMHQRDAHAVSTLRERLARAQAEQCRANLGIGHRRGDPLHPGELLPGADSDAVRRGVAQHDIGRRRGTGKRGDVPAGCAGVLRQHPGSGTETIGLSIMLLATQTGKPADCAIALRFITLYDLLGTGR